MNTGRLRGLDTLRALAIVWVLMTHYSGFVSGAQTFGWMGRIGWAGVDLFFVLSGYLIGKQVAQPLSRGEAWSIGHFFARRLLRTLPNYLVVLVIYLLLPGPPLGGTGAAPLWRYFTFTQNFGLAYGQMFTHSWSLCIEEQFYVVLPLAALAFARAGRSPWRAWVGLAVGVAAGVVARGFANMRLGHDAFDAEVYYSTFCRFDELLPGVALAMLECFHPATFDKVRRHGQVLLAGGVVMVVAVLWCMATQAPGSFIVTTFGYSLLAFSFAVLVLAALSPASLLHRARVPGAASLALWSYAIYLAHKPLFMLLAPHLPRWHLDPKCWPTCVAVIAGGICCGWILYRAIERPFMQLRSHLFPTGAVGATATSTESVSTASA